MLGQLLLEHVAHEELAQHGTASLIAQDIAQWRHIVDHFLAVVVAAVAASAQNACYAWLMLAQCTRSGKQVAVDLYLGHVGHIALESVDNLILDFVANDAGAIVVNLGHFIALKAGHEFGHDALGHFFLGHEQCVHAGGEDLSNFLFSV